MAGSSARLPPPGVPIIRDPQTGFVNEDWYTYFASLRLVVPLLRGTGSPVPTDGATVLRDLADDTAAAAAGVPIHGLYRTGSTVKIRAT